MAKPFDATLNRLIDIQPGEWADCFGRVAGIPPGPSVAIDTDLATTLQADKVFRIDGARPSLLHLELEANPRRGIPRELMRYNVLVDHQHDLPVETVLVLLRPKALASDQDGCYRRVGAGGGIICEFRYHVMRVWEQPIEFWLQSGVSLAPLALLTDEADADLESALSRFREFLREQRTEEGITGDLLGSSYVLCGLRYDPLRIAEMYRRLSMLLEDSTTYREILEKGVSQGLSQGLSQGFAQGEKNSLVRIGTKRFGPPSASVSAVIQSIVDSSRLERLLERLLDAKDWDDLLAGE
jgi:hypothetical protein